MSTGAGPKRGSEATERGEGVGGRVVFLREIFKENVCMKTAFSCTLNAIIRGSLCSDIDQFPTLFFVLADQPGGGGGALCPLSYGSARSPSPEPPYLGDILPISHMPKLTRSV